MTNEAKEMPKEAKVVSTGVVFSREDPSAYAAKSYWLLNG